MDHKVLLRGMFDAAVGAAHPRNCLSPFLPPPVAGRTVVVGAGKASAAMAAAFEGVWQASGRGALEGLVVTQYGHGVPCAHVRVIEAGHPVPDAGSMLAAKAMRDLVADLVSIDQVVALVSGGGSALLSLPPREIGTATKLRINKALLRSGASIAEMNCVRKHLSKIKGGRLARAAHPARVTSLVLSDIPGDDLALIASGPTIPDASEPEDAIAVLDRYAIARAASVDSWLKSDNARCPAPGDADFMEDEAVLVGSAQLSLEAAARFARSQGYRAYILSDRFEGEASHLGQVHANIVRQVVTHSQPFERPCVLLSGGETTVTVGGHGKGGRNTEFLLSLAIGIEGLEGVSALAADTDGRDGSEDNAGAYCDGTSAARMRNAGIEPQQVLDHNNAWAAFHSVGDLLLTGPTHTNVNDLRAVVIG